MNETTKAVLKIAINEKIRRREELTAMAEQYRIRADKIEKEEIEQLSQEIREIQAETL